jgi:hypothetical protein
MSAEFFENPVPQGPTKPTKVTFVPFCRCPERGLFGIFRVGIELKHGEGAFRGRCSRMLCSGTYGHLGENAGDAPRPL